MGGEGRGGEGRGGEGRGGRFRFRCIYLVILQTQETSAKTKFGRCRIGHLEKNKVYNIHVCKNNSNY